MSKAAADKQTKITTKGSGSWEDDAQQVLYLEASKKGRFLTLDKRRFETETTRYELDSRYATFEAQNELGITVQVECVYGWPKPADDELPDQCKDFKDSELLSKVVEVVKAGFGLNQDSSMQGSRW